MSLGHPLTNGWNGINVNGVAYLTRTWLNSAGSCAPAIDYTACGYISAHEFQPGSSLANFVGVNAPNVGDFINVYDFTQFLPQGNHGSNCIEILAIIDQNTYNSGSVTCPGPFDGMFQGNVSTYPNCPCTVAANIPQVVEVGSHVNSPFSIYPIYTQGGLIPLSWRYPDCQTCIQTNITQDCGCTSTTLKPVSNGGSTGTWPSLPPSNFVNQWGSHAVQPCCTLCDGTDDNDCCVWPYWINPNPATQAQNPGVIAGCADPNAWNFCRECTHDCGGIWGSNVTSGLLTPTTTWPNTDTSCCRYSCPPPPVPKPTWDCCTYATCPETFQLHYGPGSAWALAHPGQPTPSVNFFSKFCHPRTDGTGQWNSKHHCKLNCHDTPIIHKKEKGDDDTPFKTQPGGRSIRDMIRSNFNILN